MRTSSERIEAVTFRVLDPERQTKFYCEVLGMRTWDNGLVGYSDAEAGLRFFPALSAYKPRQSDLYWKIAISVPDIKLACRQLREKGVLVTEPKQFRDVGYLAHFNDPEGFPIELIDHWFQGDRGSDLRANSTSLGGGAHLSLVTLRTNDIESLEPNLLGMSMVPLSVQKLEDLGFNLYFYAWTDENPPNQDLFAIENRTWVYQRPYTVLEIQHVLNLESVTDSQSSTAGYSHLTATSSAGFGVCEAIRMIDAQNA